MLLSLLLLLLLLLLHTYGPCFLAILSALDDIPTQDTHTYIDTRHTTSPPVSTVVVCMRLSFSPLCLLSLGR